MSDASPSGTKRAKGFGLVEFVLLGIIAWSAWELYADADPTRLETVARAVSLVVCAVLLALMLLARLVPGSADTPEDAAAEIMRQQKALYSGPHEFVRVGPEAFKGLDLAFYDDTGAFLYSQGFGYLADLQDRTALAEFPGMYAVIRTMLGDGGTVCAGTYHLRMLGAYRVFQWLGVIARRMKVLDLESELTDGTFVVTSNSLGADTTGEFAGVDRLRLPPLTPLPELLDAHRSRVAAALAARPGAQTVVMRDLSDALAMQHRLQEAKNAHKRNMGFMSAQELSTIMGGRGGGIVREVGREIEAIRAAERCAPQPPPRLSRP